MAERKAKSGGDEKRAPSVTHRVTDDGTHEIGVRDKGRFVPFATLSAARYGQLLERAANIADAGDEASEDEGAE